MHPHPAAARTRVWSRRAINTPASRSRPNRTSPNLAYPRNGACSHVVSRAKELIARSSWSSS